MKKAKQAPKNNPVAKYAREFNKAQVFACKRQKSRSDYKKHKQKYEDEE